jgi:alkylhydroperoxidase family enzyme
LSACSIALETSLVIREDERMARIPQVTYESAPPEIQAEWKKVIREHGSVTNMKATLMHSPVALHAVLEWYALLDEVKPWLGERASILFCNAISKENACTLCSSYMRREIVQWGEDPDLLEMDDREKAVVEFGRQLAADPNRVGDTLFARLSSYFNSRQIVELTVFGTLMIVNNVFNSALQVDLDSSLDGFHWVPDGAATGRGSA